MHFSRTLLPLAAILLGAATATIHQVTVGAGGKLAFEPNNIVAAVGDSVEFTFFAKNHSIAQSAFSQPCQPLFPNSNGASTLAPKQIYSGFVPTAAPGPNPKIFRIDIYDATKPIWLYCSQTVGATGGHCQNGMVMAINAPTAEGGLATFAAYLELAKMAKSPSSGPGDGVVQGGVFVSSNNTPGGTATAISTPPFYTTTSSAIVDIQSGFTSTYTSNGAVFTTFVPTTVTVTASATLAGSPTSTAASGGAGSLGWNGVMGGFMGLILGGLALF